MARRCVVDANASLGLFLRLPYSDAIDKRMREWQAEEAKIVVPTLWEYECLTGLRRAVVLKLIPSREAKRLVEDLYALDFQKIGPTLEIHYLALQWAERIGQSKVYDAQYLALAESLSAEFWTADKRLFHILAALGIDWAHAL